MRYTPKTTNPIFRQDYENGERRVSVVEWNRWYPFFVSYDLVREMTDPKRRFFRLQGVWVYIARYDVFADRFLVSRLNPVSLSRCLWCNAKNFVDGAFWRTLRKLGLWEPTEVGCYPQLRDLWRSRG